MKGHIATFVHVFYGILIGIFIYSRWLSHVIGNSKLNPRACLLRNHLEQQIFPLQPAKERQLLIVGIVTSPKSLNSRVLTINRTWARRIPGKVIFFLHKGQHYVGELPVVSLDNVLGDVYPPRLLSLAILDYMYRQYGQTYEWFLRADDDIFINVSNLELFLKSLNSSKPEYIGQPGLFKSQEIDGQDVGPMTPFCMGGPGVILSWRTLESLGPGLADCIKTTVTGHEDTELGRCVYNTVGIHCTASYQMSTLLYEIRNKSVIHPVQPALLSALTIHPLKNSSQVYRLQILLQEHMLRHVRLKLAKLKAEISETRKNITQVDNNSLSSGLLTSSDGSEWNFIQSGKYYSRVHPYRRPWSGLRFMGKKSEFDTTVAESYERIVSKNMTCYAEPKYAYWRLTPNRGVTHMLTFKCAKTSQIIVSAQKKFQSPVVEEPLNLQNVTLRLKNNIYIVLSVQNLSMAYLRFVKYLTSLAGKFSGGIYLCMAVKKDVHNDHLKLVKLASEYSKKKNIQINILLMDVGDSNQKGIHRCIHNVPKHGLILWTDPGVVFTVDFFHRLLLNTVENKQAYFPITFSAFNRKTICYKKKQCNMKLFNLTEDLGMWRHFGYGTMGIYKSDLIKFVIFNTSNTDLGHEGTELYNDFVQSYLHIFRAVDPGITFLNQETNCTFNISQTQIDACRKLTYTFFGSQKRLAEMYLDIKNMTWFIGETGA